MARKSHDAAQPIYGVHRQVGSLAVTSGRANLLSQAGPGPGNAYRAPAAERAVPMHSASSDLLPAEGCAHMDAFSAHLLCVMVQPSHSTMPGSETRPCGVMKPRGGASDIGLSGHIMSIYESGCNARYSNARWPANRLAPGRESSAIMPPRTVEHTAHSHSLDDAWGTSLVPSTAHSLPLDGT